MRFKVFGGVGLGALINALLGFAGGDGAVFPLKVLRFWFWIGGEPEISIGDILSTTFWSLSGLRICSRESVRLPINFVAFTLTYCRRVVIKFQIIFRLGDLLVLKLLRLDPVSEGVTAIGTTPLANWHGDTRLFGLFFGFAMGYPQNSWPNMASELSWCRLLASRSGRGNCSCTGSSSL